MDEWTTHLMGHAQHAASKSKDSTQVGGRVYVYAHYEADTGRLFYIGKGCGRRAWSRSQRNRHWKAVEEKHGRTVEILKDGLSESEAYAVEAAAISAVGLETLATYTGGGRGISGYRHTEAARAAMTAARLGRSMSAEARARMSEVIRSRPDLLALRSAAFSGENNPAKSETNRTASSARMRAKNPMADAEARARMAAKLKGRSRSAEARAKQSAALTGRKRGPMPAQVATALAIARQKRKRPVVTGCGLRFDSTLSAAKALGIRQGNIVNNCAGRAKSAGGYTWSYANEPC